MECENCLKKERLKHEREDRVCERNIKRGAELKESRKRSPELVQGVLDKHKFRDNLEKNYRGAK